MNELVKRQHATQSTIRKFGGRTFKWGSCDCAKLVYFHLKQFGWKAPRPVGYKGALGAAKKLKLLGYPTLPDLIAGLGLEEIPLSRGLIGDVVSFPSDEGVGGVGVVIGNGNMFCFHQSHQFPVFMSMDVIDKCWRVISVKSA